LITERVRLPSIERLGQACLPRFVSVLDLDEQRRDALSCNLNVANLPHSSHLPDPRRESAFTIGQ